MKKHVSLILATLIMSTFLAGCNSSNKNSGNNSSTEQVSSEGVDEFAEIFYYETYIDELDSYMNRYIENKTAVQDGFKQQEVNAVDTGLSKAKNALDKLVGISCPQAIRDEHDKLLSAVEREKQIVQCNVELSDYIGKMDSLTPDEQDSLQELNQKANDILVEIEEVGSIQKHWREVRAAACSHLPKGEYNTYHFTLELLWSNYLTDCENLFATFFGGEAGNIYQSVDDCTARLSDIENMEAPERLKSYHDDIVDAIPTEQGFIDLIKEYEDIRREYAGVEFADLPDDVKKKVTDIEQKIDTFLEDETLYNALYNAVDAASKYALQQIGK